MSFFFKENRDIDFLKACNTVRQNTHGYISASDIARKALYTETESFYILPRRLSRIIYMAQKGTLPISESEPKNEFYKEVQKRYHELSQVYKNRSILGIAKIIAEQKAPRFYMSEARAIDLYYEMMRKKAP